MAIIGTILNAALTLQQHVTAGDVSAFDSTGTPDSTVSGGIAVDEYGYLSTGPYAQHILSDWVLEMHITSLSGRLAVGIYDEQFAPPAYAYRHHVLFVIDSSTAQSGFWADGGYGYWRNIPSTFNYADFTIRVHYKDMQANIFLKDSNGIISTNSFRYNPINHALNSRGRFGYYVISGTAIINEFGVKSDFVKSPHYLFLGDSITAGRKNYPESKRFSDRIKQKFYDAGQYSKRIENWATGGATLDDIIAIRDSIVDVAPQSIIMLVGANIEAGELAAIGGVGTPGSWGDRYVRFVKDIQDTVGTVFHLISITGVVLSHWDYQPIQNYMVGQFNSDLVSIGGTAVHLIDILTVMSEVGFPGHFEPMYMADYIHPNALGHQTIADLIYPTL